MANVCHTGLVSELEAFYENSNFHLCFTDSNSLLDDTDAEFRSRVEKIRQMGGDSWLKIFGEIQGEEEMAQVRAAFIIMHSDVNFLVNGDFYFF